MSVKFPQIAKRAVCGGLILALSLPMAWAWNGLPRLIAEESTDEAVAEDAEREVRYWIRQLDADQFAKRQEASEKLLTFGGQAIAPLEEGAQNGNGEVVSRSIDILRKFATSEEEGTSGQAVESLKRLAEAGNRTASRLSKAALDEVEPMRNRRGMDFARQQIAGGAVFPQGGAQRTMSIKNINGDQTIEVTENGVTKKIEKTEAGKVTVTVTEGDEPAKVVSADSPELLKKQDEEAYAVYEELSKLAGEFRAPNGARGFRAQMPAFPGGGFPELPGADFPEWADFPRGEFGADFDPIDEIQKQMERMRTERERIMAQMEEMRADRFDGFPMVPEFRRIAPPGMEREERARDTDVSPEKHLETLKTRLGKVLEKLESEEGAPQNQREIQRLERMLEAIERSLNVE
ncbi:MAG: hypothetical protein WDZ51_16530 [Pirellulaceae bacterium]